MFDWGSGGRRSAADFTEVYGGYPPLYLGANVVR
jgi:hypothetical protein